MLAGVRILDLDECSCKDAQAPPNQNHTRIPATTLDLLERLPPSQILLRG